MSLKKRILDHLKKTGGWVNGGFYEAKALSLDKKASNASRRLRELENAGEIERKEVKSSTGRVSVWYRAKQPYKRVEYYIPALNRKIIKYE